MTPYRCYEAIKNAGGGIEGCQTGWTTIHADTAREAAIEFWGPGWEADERTVIVATDDDGDSYHFYPFEEE